MVKLSKNSHNFKEIIYLTLDDILVIHTDQIERYGGSHGIRDLGLLESALFRPQSSFGGEDLYPSFFEKTAVLVHSLLLNHAFVDGNKRTSMASLLVFLHLNDYNLLCSQNELIQFALSIENKKMNLEGIVAWLKKYSKKES